MDGNQFDHVAKAVGAGPSRRRLVAGLLGAALSGALGRATGSAKGKRPPRRQQRATAPKGGKPQGHDHSQGDTHKPCGAACKQDVQCQSGRCCAGSGRKPSICGASVHNPTRTYRFTAIPNDPNNCYLTVTFTGLAGCTTYLADLWTKEAQGSVNGGEIPATDVSGTTHFDLGYWGNPSLPKGQEIDLWTNDIPHNPANWELVTC